jgi:DNA-binding transcriptional regulator YdaS (Cro superfamily)
MIDQKKLNAVLAGLGLAQWQLAKRLRRPPSTLSDYVRGVRPVPPKLVQEIERALKLPPGALNTDA